MSMELRVFLCVYFPYASPLFIMYRPSANVFTGPSVPLLLSFGSALYILHMPDMRVAGIFSHRAHLLFASSRSPQFLFSGHVVLTPLLKQSHKHFVLLYFLLEFCKILYLYF